MSFLLLSRTSNGGILSTKCGSRVEGVLCDLHEFRVSSVRVIFTVSADDLITRFTLAYCALASE